jgi:hypothetical protein
MFYGEGSATDEHETACRFIIEARSIRQKYHGSSSTIIHSNLNVQSTEITDELQYRMGNTGVMEIFSKTIPEGMITIPTIDEFTKDYNRLVQICNDGVMRSFWYARFQCLIDRIYFYSFD